MRLPLILLVACGASTTHTESRSARPLETAAPSTAEYEGEPIVRSPARFPTHELDQPWRPDPTAPRELNEVARVLFDVLGMPDTRRLELRHATVHVGNVWGGDASVQTIAWLLPERIDGQPFVLARDGLVYPAERIGEPAAPSDTIERDEQRSLAPSPDEVLADPNGLIWIAQLLRAGEIDEARAAWDRIRAEVDPEARPHPRFDPPFVATNWLWYRIERAVCAHMRGDDPLALHDARIADRVMREHPQRFEESQSGMDVIPTLLADQERRAREPVRMPRENVGSAALDASVRVPQLIAELDQVAARQWGQPGGVNLADDVVVRELIQIGEPSVEALIEVLESDQRLTRSVHFWRDFARSRTVLGVHEAAYAALASILQTSFFTVAATGDNLSRRGDEGRRTLAASIREHWERFRDMPLADRWLAILMDDAAGTERWIEAANNIVTPENVEVRRGSMMGIWTQSNADGSSALRGEPLRDRANPSVVDLLGERIASTPPENACPLASSLDRWDAQGGRPALRTFLGRCENDAQCACAPLLFSRLGDERGVLRRYARWLSHQELDGGYVELAHLLRPAIDHDSRVARRAADQFLAKPELVQALRHQRLDAVLFSLPSFRRRIATMLEDRSVIGTLSVREDGSYSYTLANHMGGGGGSVTVDDVAAQDEVPLRMADDVAMKIDVDDAPQFQIVWSESRRNAALDELVAWLRR